MEKEFKHIVSEVQEGEPAIIRFFNPVTEYYANSFINEFLWLEACNVSKISVHINCSGGSVLYGMSVFSVINNSKIETECINEGLAASMGSIIWAAGDKALMRDYAILMIHNPFHKGGDKNEISDVVKAYRHQLEMIYTKRWGMSQSEVQSIMNGEDGKDGTFMNAQEAVSHGIITQDNIISTSKQLIDKVQNAIAGISDVDELSLKISDVCNAIIPELVENKHSEGKTAILDREPINSTPVDQYQKTKKQMEEKQIDFNYAAVSAALGFQEKATTADVMKRIHDLAGVENKLSEATIKINNLEIEKAGVQAKLEQAEANIETIQAQLDKYHQAEKEAQDAKILELVSNAINEGKIKAEAKESWIQMAETNFDMAKATLESIPGKDKISDKIATDPDNIEAVITPKKTVEEQIQEKIKEVLGEDFELKSMN